MMFDKLKNLLKIENFAGSITLKDGTPITVDGNLETGSKCSVMLPGNETPMDLPAGEYPLEDDQILVIGDGGIITEIKPKPEEEQPVAEPVVEEEVVEQAACTTEETEVTDETLLATSGDTAAPAEPTDVEKKVADLEARLKALEEALNVTKQSNEKMSADFASLKEKLETTDGAIKLSKQTKVIENESAVDRKYRLLTGK